jgi:Protein of unknown function (DUF3551)
LYLNKPPKLEDIMFHRHQAALATALSTVAILAFSTPGHASANLPYCTVEDTVVECFYATLYQCEQAGRNTGRTCMLNPDQGYSPAYAQGYSPAPARGYSSALASSDMPPLQPTLVAQTGRNQMASASTADIRRMCIAQAQARHPDNGLGTVTVMTQRKLTYSDCARQNGIRP